MSDKNTTWCTACGGTGVDPVAKSLERHGAVLPLKCALCDGTGRVTAWPEREPQLYGSITIRVTSDDLDGGYVVTCDHSSVGSQGDTIPEAIRNFADAFEEVVRVNSDREELARRITELQNTVIEAAQTALDEFKAMLSKSK